MNKKIVAIWFSMMLMLSLFVVVDVSIDFTPTVSGTTRYVNTTGSGAYSKIQDAINDSNDGDTVFVYNGTYYENVIVNRSINLTGENMNTTIIDGSGRWSVVQIDKLVNYVNITGFTVQNSGSNQEDSGIKIETSSEHNIISGNIVINNSDGIYINGSCHYIIIKDNNITNNSNGIRAVASTNIEIINNSVMGNDNDGIYIALVEYTKILNNTVMYNDGSGIELMSGSNHNTIKGNNASYNWVGISLHQASYNTLEFNNVTSNSVIGIDLWDSSNIYVINNSLMNNSEIWNGYYGIYTLFTSNILMMENTLIDEGLYIYGDQLSHFNTHIIATNNTVNGKPLYYHKNQTGVDIDSIPVGQLIMANCSYFNVTNLNIANTDVGIEIAFSNNNTIMRNNLENDLYGIIALYSSDNYICGNNISNATGGIHLISSSSNSIIENNLSNDFGLSFGDISIGSSANNKVYHNNIMTIFNAVIDDSDLNNWNDSYPSGGNYWSEYMGIDEYRGPNQDIPGSDGIGDTPFVIDADSQDNYPLMKYYQTPTENSTTLLEGWNLISLPLIQEDQSLLKVLELIDGFYDTVEWYNISDVDDLWKVYNVNKPFGIDLSSINHTMGFWIHLTQPGNTIFLFNGTQPTENQTIPLRSGWNQVGYPSLTRYNRTQGLNNLTFGTEIYSIWTYNASIKKWKELGSSDFFEPGRGYWIFAISKCEWEVPL